MILTAQNSFRLSIIVFLFLLLHHYIKVASKIQAGFRKAHMRAFIHIVHVTYTVKKCALRNPASIYKNFCSKL